MKIKNLKIQYWEKNIFNNLDLEIPENKFTIILGKNGSGKSSLAKAMMNIIKYKGSITIKDKDIKSFKIKQRARKFAYMPQKIEFDNQLTVKELLEFARHPYSNFLSLISGKDKKIIKHWSDKLNITKDLNQRINNLSGGQRQRVILTSVLIQDTEYLILDEPNNNLDIKYRIELLEILSKLKNKTIILISHDINNAIRYSDHLIVISNKKIIYSGKPKEINKKIIEDSFNVLVKKDENWIFSQKPKNN